MIRRLRAAWAAFKHPPQELRRIWISVDSANTSNNRIEWR